jgi:hypothetical protein
VHRRRTATAKTALKGTAEHIAEEATAASRRTVSRRPLFLLLLLVAAAVLRLLHQRRLLLLLLRGLPMPIDDLVEQLVHPRQRY